MFNFFNFIVLRFFPSGYDLQPSSTRGMVLLCYGLPIFSFQFKDFAKFNSLSFLHYHLDLEDFNSWTYISVPLLGAVKIGRNSEDTTGGITGFDIGLISGYIAYRKMFKGKYLVNGTMKREWNARNLFLPRGNDMVEFDRIFENALEDGSDVISSGFFYKIRFTPFIRVKSVIAIVKDENNIEHKAYNQLFLRPFTKKSTKTLVERVVTSSVNNVIAAQ